MTNLGKKLLLIMFSVLAITSCKTMKESTSSSIDYMYFPATDEEKNVAIIILGGSEGGIPTHNSELTKGCPVMRLGYFGTQNTPKDLMMIEIEYLNNALAEFKLMDDVKNKKIVVIGTSKGGELSLLWASINPEIDGVIAIVPSSVVFQGLGWSLRAKSSWSIKSKPINFVPYPSYDFSSIDQDKWLDFYIAALDQDIDMEPATIKVEDINGPILLLSGAEDTMWPATKMSNDVIERLKDKGFGFDYEHIAYEDAGHSLNETYLMGGSMEGNEKARIDSEAKILEFINKLDK